MKIKTLLNKAMISYDKKLINHKVNGLKDDSKSIKRNDIFFAIKGGQTDGKNHISEAIKNGALTIIYEGEVKEKSNNVNYIKVENVKKTVALFCKIFYKNITKKVKLIAVTGTNGKTTITSILSDFLSFCGEDVLLIGTNGIYFLDEHYHTNNTTINIIDTYEILKASIKKGCKYFVMEASSIGIREARVLYFDFDIIIYTNLTHDHLDYHKNMTDYKFSKALLLWGLEFKRGKCVILNKDCEHYQFLNSLTRCRTVSYGIKEEADFMALKIKKSLTDTIFTYKDMSENYLVKTSLVGGFNVYNLLAVFATIKTLGYNVKEFVDFLKFYISVNGRMNKIFFDNRTVIVDFAHTPTSIYNVLSTLKEFTNNKITVILGCGGNRDVSKRNIIANIVLKFADKIIFTLDNPRDEDPNNIIKDMVKDIPSSRYRVILNRKVAIETALNESKKDEVIALLGKGSEKEQIINGIKYPFSDKETVYNWINKNKIVI